MPHDGNIDNLRYEIGGLKAAVESLTRQWGEQDRKATEGRRELYRQVGDMRLDINTLQQKVEPITLLDQRIDKLEAARERAIGAVWGARAVIAALGGAIGAVLTKFGLK